MWVLKIKFHNKENIFHDFANKYEISYSGYPLNSYQKNKQLYLNMGGKINCTKNTEKELIKLLTKRKEIVNFELHNNFLIYTVKQPNHLKCLFSSEIMFIKPISISNQFYQECHLGCWDKEPLSEIIKLRKYDPKSEILSFKEEKVEDINITKIGTKLTKKQENILNIAFNNGYYNYPKKIKLKDLAKISEISLSTLQAHLKKAENKIINLFCNKVDE